MIDSKLQLIGAAVEEATGANISVKADTRSLRVAVNIWFSDLRQSKGPFIVFGPTGLKRHTVKLELGRFSGPVIKQMSDADTEAVQLSRALVSSIEDGAKITFPEGMDFENWRIDETGFSLTVEKRNITDYSSDLALQKTCIEIVSPLMAAVAELIGYREILPEQENDEAAWEGAIKRSVVTRRERNPRNRLLCLRVHGEICNICELDTQKSYGDAGSIIEVHHLEPLSNIIAERQYDPSIDLIPLCPNCHRAVHTRRPVPWAPEDIKEQINIG